jgi:carboxy-cis,cis-muconate cyclase
MVLIYFTAVDKSTHRAATVRLSATNSVLYATTRGSFFSPGSPGYVSAFTLLEDGSISSQDFILPTTTGGGGANQVLPAPFDDNYFAIIDSSVGFVEMWKRNGSGSGAAVVAHLSLTDGAQSSMGGCCSNAVWL